MSTAHPASAHPPGVRPTARRRRAPASTWVSAATALLVALAATATFTQAGGFAGWARPAGVAVGVVAAWLRVPFVLVVVLAAGTAAGLRWLGVP